MYQNPKRAKKLYKEIVPKAVDEYLDNIEKSKKQTEQQLVMKIYYLLEYIMIIDNLLFLHLIVIWNVD